MNRNTPTPQLEDALVAFYESKPYPALPEFIESFIDGLDRHCARLFRRVPYDDLGIAITTAAGDLYVLEGYLGPMEKKFDQSAIGHGQYRDYLFSYLQLANNPKERLATFSAALFQCFDPLIKALPPHFFVEDDDPEGERPRIMLGDLVSDLPEVIEQFQLVAFQGDLFPHTRRLLSENSAAIARKLGKTVSPTGYRGSPKDIVKAYLAGTPLHDLLLAQIQEPPLTAPKVSEEDWYSHSLLIAPTQTGKTNIIQWRLANLLPQIAAGKASVVLMEPKGVLTADILNLAQTWDMRDRVIILDPADAPVSVNVFDKGDGSPQTLNETIARVSRIINTLSLDLRDFQRDAITFALRAMFALPEPTNIDTLMHILRGGKTVLPLDILPRRVRTYFELDFQPTDGRYIVSRLNSLLNNPIFEALFTGERTTFDMHKEIQAGKLIVINCSSRALAGDSKLYARFWIEEVQRCVFPRLAMPRERRTPTTFIIDEAQDYIAEDRHIAALLAQAAEARIGMMFGMHYLGQLTDTFVKAAVSDNTRLKFAANTSTDVLTLARAMGKTDTDFLSGLPLYEFAYFGPGMQSAIKVKFPLVDFGAMPQMSQAQYAQLRNQNRERYAYVPSQPAATPAPEVPLSALTLDLAGARAALEKAIKDADWATVADLKDSIIPALEREVADAAEPKPASPSPEPPAPRKEAPPGGKEATRDWC